MFQPGIRDGHECLFLFPLLTTKLTKNILLSYLIRRHVRVKVNRHPKAVTVPVTDVASVALTT